MSYQSQGSKIFPPEDEVIRAVLDRHGKLSAARFLGWACELGLTSTQFRVLCEIKRQEMFMEDFPTSYELLEFMKMKRDTLFAALKDLTEMGLVSRQPRPGYSTVFRVLMPDGKPTKS